MLISTLAAWHVGQIKVYQQEAEWLDAALKLAEQTDVAVSEE